MFQIRIFKHYMPLQYIILALIEYWVLIFAVYLAVKLKYPWVSMDLMDYTDPMAMRAMVFAVLMLFCTLSLGVYQAKMTEGFSGVAVRTVVAFFLLGCAALTILYYVIPDLQLGRGVLSISVVISLFFCLLVRGLFFLLVDSDKLRRRFLIWGAGDKAAEVLKNLEVSNRDKSIKICGFIVSGNRVNPTIPEHKILNLDGDLLSYCIEQKVDEIVVAMDERRRELGGNLPVSEMLDCKLSGVDVISAVDFCEREIGRIELSHLDPSWMLFSEGFRYSWIRDISKRIFDIVIAGVLLLLAWPFMLITAIAVMIDDGAPILYRQVRVGLNGKTFILYKFRSMKRDAEKNGAVWAQKDDDRVTSVGAFIRNTRLDELPQIYNVLKGDMSFVGPRPERPELVDRIQEEVPFYSERHRVKPGVMGWAQLKYPYGASIKDAAQKLRYDLYYTKNHSLLLDTLIVIQTVEVVILGKGVR